jgi:UDP-GlcNAc:undecaprenyl-phosphate GlcNAc-1-phosphate transferase
MLTLLCTFCVSFALSLVLTPLVRVLALRYGLVDRPDNRRKMHGRPIPVAGGVAVLLAGVLTLALTLLLPHSFEEQLSLQGEFLLGLFCAALIICTAGVADDFGYLRVRHKLLSQIIAAGILMACGVLVHNIRFFEWDIPLGLLAIPFTLCFLLGAINSLNLLDGMDGLLGTLGLIISLAIAIVAGMNDKWASAWVALALAGAVLGFLRYNFPPASIFLGDSGSMLIGLVIGALAIQSSLKATATASLAAPMALLTIPLFDTVAAILRRKLTGRSIYDTDRGHLHHCLLRRGYTTRRVLAVVSCFCLLTVAGALASLFFRNELLALLSAVAVVVIMVVTRLFGHAEFSLLRQSLYSLALSFLHRRAHDAGQRSEVRLQGSVDWSELWTHIIECGQRLNLTMVRLDVNAPAIHEGYHARWDRAHREMEDMSVFWYSEVPLVAHGRTIGRLEVTGARDDEPIWQKIAVLAGLVQEFESTAAVLIHGAAEKAHPEQEKAHPEHKNGKLPGPPQELPAL